MRCWPRALLLLLVTSLAGPARAAPPDAARDAYAAHLSRTGQGSATIEEHRGLALGAFRFFGVALTGPIPRPGAARFHRGAASAAGLVGEQPGLWRQLLLAGPPDEVARRVQFLLGDGGRGLLSPGQPAPNTRISPHEWGLIAAPARTVAADGAVTFTAWFGSPPGFYPERLSVIASATTAVPVFRWEAATRLLPAETSAGQKLREALRSNDVTALRWAIGQVEYGGSRSPHVAWAVPRLIELLGHDSPRVRFSALVALARFEDPRAAEPVLAALPGERDWTVRYMMLRVLGRLRVERAVPAIARTLDDADGNVRLDAVDALGQIRSPAAREVLQQAARTHRFPDVRARAASVLSRRP